MDETKIIDHEARIKTLEREFGEIRDDVKLTRIGVQRLEVQLATSAGRQHCAAPSLCLSLQPRIAELEKGLRELESERDKAAGGLHVARFVLVLLGGATGSILTFLVQYAIKHL